LGKVWLARSRPAPWMRAVTADGMSFPSGHTANATAFFVSLAALLALRVVKQPRHRAMIVIAASIGGAAVGATRVVLGVHWLSDAVAGWSLGVVVALTWVGLAERLGPVGDSQRLYLRAGRTD
jgi:undecaprenyl-diphosphatase